MLRMNMSFQLILIWIPTLFLSLILPVSYSHKDGRMITIDETGNSTIDCCTHGNCSCSNLSLALEHIQGNTEIRIVSNISLHDVSQFNSTNDANITIIGYNNLIIRCDHKGGLVGRNIGYIVIQSLTWDGCDEGIVIDDFINIHITDCNFQNILSDSVNFTLTFNLKSYGSVCINNSAFINIINRGVSLTVDGNNTPAILFITVYNSTFNNATLAITINNKTFHNDVILNITIRDCSFSNNTYHSLHCRGVEYFLPTVSVLSSNFTNNLDSSVKAEKCNIILQECYFFLNDGDSAIDISYGTISMTGLVLFHNNIIYSTADSYGGAISLFNSNMSVIKGPIKFHNNIADYGGALYICKNSSIFASIRDLEFYNNSARFYGGALYIESSPCDSSEKSIPSYYNLLLNAHHAASNTARLGGNFVYFYAYGASCCKEPNMLYKNGNLFATQPSNIESPHGAKVFGNFIDDSNAFNFWLHDLQFTLIITDCFNNLYGPAQVFVCCGDDYSCDERYEYIVDSTHNNVTMISNDTVVSCPFSEGHTIKLFATSSDRSISKSTIEVQILASDDNVGYCKDIAHVDVTNLINYGNSVQKCLALSCYLQDIHILPKGIHCTTTNNDYIDDFNYRQHFTVTPGYWFSNGFIKYVDNCPQGHCNSRFSLYDRISMANFSKNVSYPNSNNLCAPYWTNLSCGECDGFVIHDSTRCVPLKTCLLKKFHLMQLVLFFFISLLYWIIVISLIFVLLHFKFDITAGYAYGIIFYYSILEKTVNASHIGTQNNFNTPLTSTILTVLSSIGNMKPPFQLLRLCFWNNAKMMDHMFLTYIHPVIVTFLIVTIFILARNSVTVARTIGRYVNSKSICILLMLSYNSVSYISVQLLRPLPIYTAFYEIGEFVIVHYRPDFSTNWHLYLSPTVKYFHGRHMIYCIIAILCELVVGISFPLILLSQKYLTRYFNINFISIKPIIDQLMGCYKEEYRWFAAYYLLCRQLLYAVDLFTDFKLSLKFVIMLTVYVLIMMVHIWLQPYKERKLNVLDSCILMTLMLVFIGEHTTYGSSLVLWSLPLVLFINCVAFSTKFKHLLIPISCLGISTLSFFCSLPISIFFYYPDDYQENYSFSLITFYISSLAFLAYMIYLCVILIKRCCKPRAQYRLINEQNEDSYEDSDSDDVI